MRKSRCVVIALASLLSGYVCVSRNDSIRAKGTTPSSPQVLIDAPIVVAQSPPEQKRWGFYQFPRIVRWEDGRLAVGFHVHPDAPESYGLEATVPDEYISADGGKTWRAHTEPGGVSGLLLPTGDRLRPVQPKPFPVSEIKLPAPIGTRIGTYGNEKYEMYRLQELPQELRGVHFSRLLRGSEEWQTERNTLTDPLALRYSIRGLFPIVWWGYIKILPDGSLLAGTYPGYMEGEKNFPSHIFFYRSTDGGKSWNLQGRIRYQPDLANDKVGARRDGFTEPAFEILGDRSLICVMRTTDGLGVGPMYFSRSLDLGKTWTKPAAFTETGVEPQLLLLKNGTLVLSSGRPGVDVRFSFDGSGNSWTKPYPLVPITSGGIQTDSCGYTKLLALDDSSLLIVYSWFKHRNDDGQERKTILVRRIRIL